MDGLYRESDPHGFTEACTPPSSIYVLTVLQPLTFEERVKNTEKDFMDALALFRSQIGHMNPAWYEKICNIGEPLFKFLRDNVRDETRRTLPKTNERDRRNQPLPGNVIGRHFGTFTRREYTGQ